MERSAYQEYLLSAPVDELFDCREVNANPPERARIFSSVVCDKCGESASENQIRFDEGKRVCLDCYAHYGRGW